MVNNVMWVGCVIVVQLFQSSAHMEAAYGLAITITMICTSVLLFFYLHGVREMKVFPWAFVILAPLTWRPPTAWPSPSR